MTQPGRTGGGAAAWLSRLIGAAILLGQAWRAQTGEGSDLTIVAAGLFLLTGRESVEFVRLLLGRDSGPPSGRSDSERD